MNGTTASVAHAREERIAEALADRMEALDLLVEACASLKDAHDRRAVGPHEQFLTLNETGSIEILRARLDEFLAASSAVILASRPD